MDTDRVVECLNKMHALKIEPHPYVLKKIGETKDLPDSIWLALK